MKKIPPPTTSSIRRILVGVKKPVFGSPSLSVVGGIGFVGAKWLRPMSWRVFSPVWVLEFPPPVWVLVLGGVTGAGTIGLVAGGVTGAGTIGLVAGGVTGEGL